MYVCMCNMYDKRPYDISCICVYVYMFNAEGCNLSPLGTDAQSEINYEHTMRTAVANRWYLLEKNIYKISLCTWKRCNYVKSGKIYNKYKI